MKKWKELTNEIAKKVYCIEMAEGFVTVSESEARWERMEQKRRMDMATKGAHFADEHDVIIRYVGSALIAMREMKLIEYD